MTDQDAHPAVLDADRQPPVAGDRVITVDDVRLDTDAVLLWVDGRHVPIAAQEFVLLSLFLHNAGRVIGREELLERAWGPDRGRMSNTVSVHISRLRRKLLRPDGTSRLRTVHGLGYVFDVSSPDRT